MKDWSEYETDIEYSPIIEIRREMRREIDNSAMTKDERERRLRELPALVSAEYGRRNAPRRADKERLLGQFWDDLRADLGYGTFLNETACKALEKLAWDRGHSGGLADVYFQADELCDFARMAVSGAKFSGDEE